MHPNQHWHTKGTFWVINATKCLSPLKKMLVLQQAESKSMLNQLTDHLSINTIETKNIGRRYTCWRSYNMWCIYYFCGWKNVGFHLEKQPNTIASVRKVMSVHSDSELQAPTHTYKFSKIAERILFMINCKNVLSSSKSTRFLQATSQWGPSSSSLTRFYVPSFKLSLLVGR